MVAYEFYWRDETGKEHLIGILPERRKNSERITKESIIRWGRMLLGDDVDSKEIFFKLVKIESLTDRVLWDGLPYPS